MSTSVVPNPVNQQPPATGTSSPSSAAPTQGPPSSAPASPPAPTSPPETRLGETLPDGTPVPVWARGKTQAEVLGITGSLLNQVERYMTTGQPPQQPAAPQTPQPFVPPPVQPQYPQYGQPAYNQPAPQYAPTQPQYDPNDFATYGALQNIAPQIVAAQMTPHLQQFQGQLQAAIDQNASTNLAIVRQKHADTFAKYGHEIYGKLGSVQKNLWTVDNLETVINLVRADHVDELAAERARQLVSTMEPSGTLRSNGGAGTVPGGQLHADLTLQSEKLPPDWKERAAKVGLTERTLDEWCQKNGMTREQFFHSFGKSGIITEVGQ